MKITVKTCEFGCCKELHAGVGILAVEGALREDGNLVHPLVKETVFELGVYDSLTLARRGIDFARENSP